MAKNKKPAEQPKVTAPSAGGTKQAPKTHVEVAAYFKWQKRGGRHGNDLGDWFEAEKDLKKR